MRVIYSIFYQQMPKIDALKQIQYSIAEYDDLIWNILFSKVMMLKS